ncbi:MAG: hypothetical protein AMXMBFR46_06450 [Acidimicrobiia bacterium]
MALAALLTIVVLAVYGGYLGWSALTGDDTTAAVPEGNGFVASAGRAAASGREAIRLGIDHRRVDLQYDFYDAVSAEIDKVQAEQANLERLHARAASTRADILRSSIDATTQLATAMTKWRDAIFGQRLGNAAPAEAAIVSAITQLDADVGRWTPEG